MNTHRRTIVEAVAKSKEGHIASAFSILDILWVLYDKVLNVDPKNPRDSNRDYFILSKGHASVGLYAVLAAKGFFPASEFDTFASFDSILGGHPDRNKVPGVEASTGSLGHGFPMAVGIALGLKIQKKPSRVIALIGDGEANEGTIWEGALLAAHHNLGSLTCIVDYNHSTDRALSLGDLKAKFEAFGWRGSVVDGHDHAALLEALSDTHPDIPTVIVAETTKGKGVKMMEHNPSWHHKSPSEEELALILAELV